MHLILGGKYMGKLKYARSLYGDVPVCDLSAEPLEAFEEKIFASRIVVNLQDGMRRLLEKERSGGGGGKISPREFSPREFFISRLHRVEDEEKILIGDEIGSGVVPLDPFERLWRDETGFLYQSLAARANQVDRVWAGIPCRLKG